MARVSIATDRDEARVIFGSATSVRFEVMGWSGTATPVVTVASELADIGEWISVDIPPSVGAMSRGTVSFDPSRGARPRPGVYPIELSVSDGGQRASTVVRFVVERHPCLRIGPRPSFTWDPFTMSAQVKVALWSCGNVDLDVTWAARLKGRRLEVDPVVVRVAGDGRIMDTTLTIKVPDGDVDIHTEIDLEAVSEAAIERVSASMVSDQHDSLPQRSNRGVTIGATVLALIVLAAVVAVVSLRGDDETVDQIAPATEVAATASAVLPSQPDDGGSNAPGTAGTDASVVTAVVVQSSFVTTEPTVVNTTPGRSVIDLRPIIGDDPLRSDGCPGGSSNCFLFTVVNAGSGASPSVGVEFSGLGGDALAEVPPLAARESVDLLIDVPDPCADNCSAAITVDPENELDEYDEENNTDEWFVVG